MTFYRPTIGIAFAVTLLAACASPHERTRAPAPLAVPAKPQYVQADPIVDNSAQPTDLVQSATPRVDMPSSASVSLGSGEMLPPMPDTPVRINVQDLPITVLANEVFNNILGLNLNIDPQVAQLQELVTLNTQENLRPIELFRLTRQVLAEYGVSVEFEGGLVQLRMAAQGTSATPPLVVSGRALPSVPTSHRPVFQLIELEVVRSGDAVRWLTTLFGQELRITEETARNAILLQGRPSQVRQAIEALRVFDRPLMRGRVSTRLEPVFMTADELSNRLTEVLNLQGYSANRSAGSPASVIVLPIAAANSVIVFATSQDTLNYAVSWARELDRPSQHAGSESMFYYQVRNTKAIDIASVLTNSLQGTTANTPAATAEAGTAGGAPSQGAAAVRTAPGSSILVDEPRNALIFQGDPAQWERMLGLIRQMDRAPRQVMIEVTIAEVTLNDDLEYGLSWFAKNGWGRFDGSIYSGSGSGGNNPGPSGGLTYLVDVAGQNRLALTALASDNRVSILSTPRLLVKSGSEASIDVGTEVPTVTMTTTSNQQTDGNTNLLQSIQYRKTGVILNIKPTVYSDDRIDLEISQEVSEALPLNSDSTAGSPSIFNRSLNTSLSLRDGGSVVMAGLISTSNTNTESGIPFIKDVPVLGNLFKSQTVKQAKTELVLLIIPYIVESQDQATELSRVVADRFDLLDLEEALPVQPPGPVLPPQRPPAPLLLSPPISD
ncbi:secretin N-terminal domain-containing protein [Luteimonas sp. MHLX1A]|uniref:secretin N-terminal domain-containing protein n=1 Tax=Alterluteimonas muca TaxID=2878684 RepID=UPI001E465EF3|nr:secretin N-terminal domain-containing protein [Luteimonas sp. MHLX1A]MCD9047789.1 hypothetical protein [Luteimonas sp. MHLX1A]